MAAGDKDPGALLTIGEVSRRLGVAQHILRYWETRFPQLKPMQRAGNRRYYRPSDVALAERVNRLLNHEGYRVRGVQKLLRDKGGEGQAAAELGPAPAVPPPAAPTIATAEPSPSGGSSSIVGRPPRIDVSGLVAIRDRLAALIEH